MAKKKKGGKKKGGKKSATTILEPEMMPLLYRQASFDVLPRFVSKSASFKGFTRIQNDRNSQQILTGYRNFLKERNFRFSSIKNPDGVCPKPATKKKKGGAKKGKKKK